ncbi:MAG: DUF4936 family protein [Betaproteobacteria bacterium]|nr:MAG: DUF4936 family protein [Betaproteobacteria bacterium]
MSAGPVCYYIYYRVDPDRATSARRAVAALLAAVESRAGVVGRLLRRQDEPLLWMEVYENVADAQGFEARLSALLSDLDFESFLASGAQRRIERFVAAV